MFYIENKIFKKTIKYYDKLKIFLTSYRFRTLEHFQISRFESFTQNYFNFLSDEQNYTFFNQII